MCKIKKSVRLPAEHIAYIMSISETNENFSECLELVIQKVILQDEFLKALATKNQFVRLAKNNKRQLITATQCQHKRNRLIRKSLGQLDRILAFNKLNREVDQYYDKLEEIN